MPALDRYHENVRAALLKEGWTITDDPLYLRYAPDRTYVDFAAERFLAAERGTQKIAVEVKTFGGDSPVAALEQAIGQYGLYELLLAELDPERELVLAVPQITFDTLFQRPLGQLVLQHRLRRIFVFDPSKDEISRWIP